MPNLISFIFALAVLLPNLAQAEPCPYLVKGADGLLNATCNLAAGQVALTTNDMSDSLLEAAEILYFQWTVLRTQDAAGLMVPRGVQLAEYEAAFARVIGVNPTAYEYWRRSQPKLEP